jgi:uncharacterized membrane protein
MANDLTDVLRGQLKHAVRDATKNLTTKNLTTKNRATKRLPRIGSSKKPGPVSGVKGVAAGAGLAALVPLAKKGVDAARSNGRGAGVAANLGDKVGSKLTDTVSEKVDDAGGLGGIAKEAAGGLIGGSDGGGGGAVPGVGKGRRMPVQQSVDVGVPVETAYNQFSQFEEWPEFMHRVTRVTNDDETTISFATKIWTRTREFKADIETQRPDERIKWRVSQGITHTGVVTFHELAPRLTRIEVNVDVDPGSLIEKAARGMRHIKRAIRADLHRFKAFIEMQEHETGAWRGVIEDGEVVEDHPEDYDAQREYSGVEDAKSDEPDEDSDEAEADEEEAAESRPARRRRSASPVATPRK